MIVRSVLMYGIFCIVPIVYGIGIKRLLYTKYEPRYFLLSGLKTVCTVLSAVVPTWFFASHILAPYSLAFLFPFFAAIATLFFSFAFERLIYICCKVKTEEFDIAFLSVVLAASEGFKLSHTLLTAVICVFSFYLLYPLIVAIRRRLTLISTYPVFNDTIMVCITLALITCGFYGWNLSWLNPGIFR